MELLNQTHALFDINVAVETKEFNTFITKYVLYYGQRFLGLTEYEKLVGVAVEVIQELVQDVEFA